MRRLPTTLMTIALMLLSPAAEASVQPGAWGGNARATFSVNSQRNNAGATGHAIFNYRKSSDTHHAVGEVTGMAPGRYTISVGTAGTCSGNTVVATFDVNDEGEGAFDVLGVQGLSASSTFDFVRIYPASRLCHTHLGAVATDARGPANQPGTLRFRGQQRSTGR